MIRLSSILSFTAAMLLSLAVTVSVADARRGGGHRGGHHHAHHHHHDHAGHHHRGKHRYGYWSNGVWIGTGAAVYGYSSGCSYAYGKWQATGSKYWRDQYYACIN